MPHDARFREKRVVRSFASSLVKFSHLKRLENYLGLGDTSNISDMIVIFFADDIEFREYCVYHNNVFICITFFVWQLHTL